MATAGGGNGLPSSIQDNFNRMLEGDDSSEGSGLHGYALGQAPSHGPDYAYSASAAYARASGYDEPRPPLMVQPGQLQPGQKPSYGATELEVYDKIDFIKMFPSIFTFSCFITFMPPIVMTAHLGNDVNVLYWIGPWCQFVVLIPFLFLFGHIIHSRKRPPYKPVVFVCLLVPSVVFLGMNDAVSTAASHKADQLLSTDCAAFTGKLNLEQSWQAAYQFYANCMVERVGPEAIVNASSSLTLSLFRIQDCNGYEAARKNHEETWGYLQALEEHYHCAGWCTFSPRLWSLHSSADSCSVAAGQMLKSKVARLANQGMMYTVVILIASSLIFTMAGPSLRRRGVEW